MSQGNEKTPIEGSRARIGASRSALLIALLAAVVGGVVYLLASRGGGRAPDMPRASFGEDELKASARGLAERAEGFEPDDDERRLIDLLERLNLAETRREPGPETLKEVRGLVGAVTEEARSLAGADRARYLSMGAHLAIRFERALLELLEAARGEGLAALIEASAPRASEARRLGGAFLAEAMDRGLIEDDGRLRGPSILPQVLFRVRWRGFAGVGLQEGLLPVERRAYMDFVAAFSREGSVEVRLQAVEELSSLDPSYDAAIARAVVLHEAGKDWDAHIELEAAIEAGRDDDVVRDFARLLGR